MENTVPEAELITTSAGLEQVVERLQHADAVAVDTEFFWERTFYPILGLVQLATADGACWLIDTVRIKDIRALGPVLASPEVTKVLHDAPQDLGILARATGALPQTVFDTRLACGFAGFNSTSSLQALLRQALGIELSKAETRSDWLRRPLSANQVRYAADDVLHLLPLREFLLARCASDAVRGWLSEDLARLDDPELYRDRDPRLMYLRVKGSSRLEARQLAILRELGAWREEEARQRARRRCRKAPVRATHRRGCNSARRQPRARTGAARGPVDLAGRRRGRRLGRRLRAAAGFRLLRGLPVLLPGARCRT